MLIKLCIDIWRDIFDWLSPSDRKRFARKFNKIGDREFSDLCQKWLHEWTKNVNLGYMNISQPPTIELTGGRLQCTDTRMARLNCFDKIPRRWREEVFPEAELPDNIRDFERIRFSYLDSKVALFLHRLQPLFQAKEVNLYMHVDDKSGDQQLDAALTALDHLVPLLNGGGIDTVTPAGHTSKLLVAIRDRFPAQFFGVKFFIIWLWTRIPTSELTELLLEWLGTGREDGQPRMLTLQAFNSADWMLGFIERIRQQFTDATSHASFFIIWYTGLDEEFQESVTKNARTGEQLVIRMHAELRILLIGRCPAEVDGQKWVEEMDKKSEQANRRKDRRLISFFDLTLGQFEETKKLEEKEEVGDVDQPGPSKKLTVL